MKIEEIKSASTAALVAEYNRLTGKTIKKFSSRVAGEKQVEAAITNPPKAKAESTPVVTSKLMQATEAAAAKGKAKPAAKTKARKVKGKAGADPAGRPVQSFNVTLTGTKAKSNPNSKSLRRQLITWLDGLTNKGTTIDAIEKKFERNMRGVVNKLEAKGWVKKSAIAA